MEFEEARRKLHYITKGIDKDECESEFGWWTTSEGAKYGAETLTELEALIQEIYGTRIIASTVPEEGIDV